MSDARPSPSTTSTSTPNITEPLLALLTQLSQVIRDLDVSAYTTAPANTKAGTIGAHVRHSIDHADAWLEGIATGRVAYDNRRRGTDVETDPEAALKRIDELLQSVAAMHDAHLEAPVTVVTSLTSDGQPVELPSTHARELGFVFSHTVHHNAMIAFLARAHGRDLSPEFGVAPSTLAYRASQSCAR